MGGPGSGCRKRPALVRPCPILLALNAAEQAARAATQQRMQVVRTAKDRVTCVLRSRELWRVDAAMLPLVLTRWQIHEDEIREAVKRPPPIAEPRSGATHDESAAAAI